MHLQSVMFLPIDQVEFSQAAYDRTSLIKYHALMDCQVYSQSLVEWVITSGSALKLTFCSDWAFDIRVITRTTTIAKSLLDILATEERSFGNWFTLTDRHNKVLFMIEVSYRYYSGVRYVRNIIFDESYGYKKSYLDILFSVLKTHGIEYSYPFGVYSLCDDAIVKDTTSNFYMDISTNY